MKNRNYNTKDVDMLMASRTIATHFKLHLEELATVRTNWDTAYADGLSSRIDSAIDEYLGADKKKELKEATEQVLAVYASALTDLSFLKAQIKIDFPDESGKILKRLGYKGLNEGLYNGDQEQLIKVLYAVKKGMNDQLKTKICSKGINPEVIDRLVNSADQLKHFNTLQESLKKTTKGITAEMRARFNAIYNEITGICKIAGFHFKQDPIIREQFVFSGIVKNMSANKSNPES